MGYTDRYSREYCDSIEGRIGESILSSFDRIVISGKDNIQQLPENSSILYTSLHKSHMDYIAAAYVFHTEEMPYPRIVAGSNLLEGIIGKVIKDAAKIDLKKAGAISIERSDKGGRAIHNTIEEMLLSEIPVMIFPEYYGGDGNAKTGRSYDGRVRKFSPFLISPAVNAAQKKENVYLAPMAISYDFPPETKIFSNLIRCSEMRRSENFSTRIRGNISYAFWESKTFLWDLFNSGKGNIYIDIADPIHIDVSGIKDKKELKSEKERYAQRSQESAFGSYRITPLSVVCKCIGEGIDTFGQILTEKEPLEDEIRMQSGNTRSLDKERESNSLCSGNGLKVINPEPYLKGLQCLIQRGIVDIKEDNTGKIEIIDQEVVDYFKNNISHALKR